MRKEEQDKGLESDDELEEYLEDPEGFARKLGDAVRKALEANTKYTLGEAEDTGSDVFYLFWLREKRPKSVFIPIDVLFDLDI